MSYQRIALAAGALFVAQLAHGLVPTEGEVEGGGPVGFYGGIVLLLASLAAAVGALQERSWARPLAFATDAVVAIGFVLYHAVPVSSPVTNPYPREPVGLPAWLTVVASVVAGAWSAAEARPASAR
jgi:hypothetical protein